MPNVDQLFREGMSEKGYELTPVQSVEFMKNLGGFVKIIKGMSQQQIFDMLEEIRNSPEPTMFGEPLNKENTEKILRFINNVKDH